MLPRLQKIRARVGRVGLDDRGSTVVEFALLAVPLCTMLMGSIELGYMAYAKSLTEGTLREAARMATTGAYTASQIDSYVTARLGSIHDVEIDIEKRSYKAFADVKQPEPLTSDAEPIGGVPSAGDCYLDIVANYEWDNDIGTEGIGQAEDIVYYGVTISFPKLFIPLGDKISISSNTVIKNEPFNPTQMGSGPSPEPVERCIPAEPVTGPSEPEPTGPEPEPEPAA